MSRSTATPLLIAVLLLIGLIWLPAAHGAEAASGGVGPPGSDQGEQPAPKPEPKDEPKPGSDGSGGVNDGSGDNKTGDGKKPKKGRKRRARGASLRLIRANPGRTFFDARRRARFEFQLRGKRRRNIVVTATRVEGAIPVKRWQLPKVKPGAEPLIRWAGWTDEGRLAPQGQYEFIVTNAGGRTADTSRAEGSAVVRFFGHRFPLRGNQHVYGDGLGAGRDHRGFDLATPCGTPVLAARGGRVQWRKFQRGGAGHYVVLDGRRTGQDYVYMHLQKKALFAPGERVRTGQVIGYVGTTGRSTGCHLHFEVWSAPGWASGGEYLDAERMARRWDRWS